MSAAAGLNPSQVPPVPSTGIVLKDFGKAASEWQKYFSGSASKNGRVDPRLLDITAADREFIDCCFGQDFRHLKKSREAFRANFNFGAEQTSLSSYIADHEAERSAAEPQEPADGRGAIISNMINNLEGMADAISHEDKKKLKRTVEHLANVVQQTPPSSRSADIRSDSLKKYCSRLVMLKNIYQDPRLLSFQSRELFCNRTKKVLDAGMPLHSNSTAVITTGNLSMQNEVILTISICTTQKPLTKLQEFQVLSSSTLSQFKDAIHCFVDSWTPAHSETVRKNSGFFLIEKVFYTDNRSSVDYTEPILKWRQHVTGKSDSPEIQYLQTVKWSDLQIRVNKPYLYLHQGDCWHNIIITDISAYHPHFHLPKRQEYPRRIFQKPPIRPSCQFCNHMAATKCVFDKRFNISKTLVFCEDCLVEYHGAEQVVNEGMLVYDIPRDIP